MTLSNDVQAHRARPIVAPETMTQSAASTDLPVRNRFLRTIANAVHSYPEDLWVAAEDTGGAATAGKVTPVRIRLNILAVINVLCGVRSRADDLDVNRCTSHFNDPTDGIDSLATATAHLAIEHLYLSPVDMVIVEIRADIITLTGEVSCVGDRLAAEVALAYLADHLSIDNQIRVLGCTCERTL